MIRFPGPGCVVEFIQGNRAQQAIVLEEQSGSLRLYTLSRREVRMPASRILPWFGPSTPLPESKQDLHSALEATRLRREALSAEIDPVYLWNIAHEEITHASARWFAELLWQEPDLDQVAACGHALLECKTHFKFNPPDFDVLSEEKAAVRLHEAERTEKRNAVLAAGRTLFPCCSRPTRKIRFLQKPCCRSLNPNWKISWKRFFTLAWPTRTNMKPACSGENFQKTCRTIPISRYFCWKPGEKCPRTIIFLWTASATSPAKTGSRNLRRKLKKS